jgi:hypothetical protein
MMALSDWIIGDEGKGILDQCFVSLVTFGTVESLTPPKLNRTGKQVNGFPPTDEIKNYNWPLFENIRILFRRFEEGKKYSYPAQWKYHRYCNRYTG